MTKKETNRYGHDCYDGLPRGFLPPEEVARFREYEAFVEKGLKIGLEAEVGDLKDVYSILGGGHCKACRQKAEKEYVWIIEYIRQGGFNERDDGNDCHGYGDGSYNDSDHRYHGRCGGDDD